LYCSLLQKILKFVTSFEDLEEQLRSDIDKLKNRMDDVEIKIEKMEDNMDWLSGMACNHITFIVLESIIVALLLVNIEWLIYYEATRHLWRLPWRWTLLCPKFICLNEST